MISGSLTKKNGYWYMILRVRDESGKSKPKWLATHLRADGNKRKAEEMLWAARRDYTDLWEMQKRNFGILGQKLLRKSICGNIYRISEMYSKPDRALF